MSDTKTPKHEVIIIGAGPAALSAAIYTTREDIETLLFERAVPGGLAAVTDWVDNYPGFPDGIAGLELAENLRKQAERFGAVIELGEVTKITEVFEEQPATTRSDAPQGEGENRSETYKKYDERESQPSTQRSAESASGVSGSAGEQARAPRRLLRLETTSGDMLARAVLIATGSDYKKIGAPGEQEYYARGVHYCATCDGAFYRDKHLIVVGGGNSAVQESMFLTRFASHIDMLVRGDSFRASEVLQKELEEKHKDKITVHFNTTTDEIVGENGKVSKVIGTDKKTGKKVEFPTDGVFVFVGLQPNSQFLQSSNVELDEIGFVKTDSRLETKMKGVFAAGDIRSGATMQIASASGEGATAALMIREYLEGKSHPIQN